MSDLPMIGLRQFRQKLDKQTEVVRVVKTRGDITFLGIWVPADGWEVHTEGTGFKIIPRKTKD